MPPFLCAHGDRLGKTRGEDLAGSPPQPSHCHFPFLPIAAPGVSELISGLTRLFRLDRQVEFSFLEKCK